MTDRLHSASKKLTANVKAHGCAAKLSSAELNQILTGLPSTSSPKLLTSIENFEDAAVYKITEDLAIVETIDFFPPVVDDPYLYGRISAANALSDVYAMGGRPILALNVLCFPTCDYPLEVVQEILRGGASQVAQAGAVLAGGHSIQSPEPVYGLAVTGIVNPGRILTNSGAKPNDKIVLCKQIGTGVGLLAMKGEQLRESAQEELLKSLTTLNDKALDIALTYDLHAATDVTGFGLVGHLHEMARGSNLSVSLNARAVCLLPETKELAEQGFVPAGAYGNRNSFEPFVSYINDADLALMDLFFDPQTSGGLMFALQAAQAEALLQDLVKHGIKACCIGEFKSGSPGLVEVTS